MAPRGSQKIGRSEKGTKGRAINKDKRKNREQEVNKQALKKARKTRNRIKK